MCIALWDPNSSGTARMTYFNAQVAFGQATVRAQNRRALVIGPPATGTITLAWDANPPAGAGIVLSAGQLPLTLGACEFGALVTEELYISSPGGAQLVTIAEELS